VAENVKADPLVMEIPVTSIGDSSGATSSELAVDPSGIPASQRSAVPGTTIDCANNVGDRMEHIKMNAFWVFIGQVWVGSITI